VNRTSIITINRNNRAGLAATIGSVRLQTLKPYEFIVIDGASDDGSKEVIAQNNDVITSFVSEPDKGIFNAHNKGVMRATGDYLLFLNSGDLLAGPSVLDLVVPLLNGYDLIYGDLIVEKGEARNSYTAPDKIDTDFMLNSTLWHPCTFIHSRLFRLYGNYNDTFTIAGDYEFFIRCLLKPAVISRHANIPICVFEGNGISNDPSMAAKLNEERERAWSLNLSSTVITDLKLYNAYTRSRYSKVINLLRKFRER
jgi:glycosyltransferase involved in cell wall biosynthesis